MIQFTNEKLKMSLRRNLPPLLWFRVRTPLTHPGDLSPSAAPRCRSGRRSPSHSRSSLKEKENVRRTTTPAPAGVGRSRTTSPAPAGAQQKFWPVPVLLWSWLNCRLFTPLCWAMVGTVRTGPEPPGTNRFSSSRGRAARRKRELRHKQITAARTDS